MTKFYLTQSHRLTIETALKEYLSTNSTPDISPRTLLEAHKPVIRGACISQASFLNKEKHPTQQRLETSFKNAHMTFQADPSMSNHQALEKARLEFYLFLMDFAEKALRRLSHKYYTKANKPDTFLALSLQRFDSTIKPI